jgi:hypothetical protein
MNERVTGDFAAGSITGLKKPLRYDIPATQERNVALGTRR